MSIGRRSSSMLSTASPRVVFAILLASFLPGANARCWRDSQGFETCDDRLSNIARVLIGIAFFLGFLAVISGLYGYRRRRNRLANQAYIQHTQGFGSGAGYGNPYAGTGGPPPFAPQFPPPAHNGVNPPYPAYDPSSGFAPASAAPPQYYPPPPGAPPVTSFKE